ncbi:MAG: RNA polymerase sigma factor [Lysinibacillus sp.]
MKDYPIAALKKNDDAVVEQIIEEHYEAIFKYCFFRVRQKEEAEDLTQEVFLHFFKAIHRYEDKGKPRAYLFRIAKHLCINWAKRNKPEYVEDIEQYNISIDEIEKNVTSMDLQIALQYLSEMEREVVLLRYMHDLPMQEIAKITQKNRFAVRYQLNKGLEKLKNYIERGVN